MKAFTPTVSALPARTVLTLTTVGDPNKVTGAVMGALYGTAYGTKFKVCKPRGQKMEIGACSAFWPDAHLKPKSKWTGVWNLEVSAFVKTNDLIQKDPQHIVTIKKLPATTVAEVLYIGPYTGEAATIKALHAFMATEKLKISGPHEEVYLTKPGPKAKTIIRYAVKKAKP